MVLPHALTSEGLLITASWSELVLGDLHAAEVEGIVDQIMVFPED